MFTEATSTSKKFLSEYRFNKQTLTDIWKCVQNLSKITNRKTIETATMRMNQVFVILLNITFHGWDDGGKIGEIIN